MLKYFDCAVVVETELQDPQEIASYIGEMMSGYSKEKNPPFRPIGSVRVNELDYSGSAEAKAPVKAAKAAKPPVKKPVKKGAKK